MSLVYGPVPSWRLGRSLGIDAVSTRGKTCSFDCVYCQLGRTVRPLTERQQFVEPEALRSELARIRDVPVDTVTFSGMAEPTLARGLTDLVDVVREKFSQPVAILTNGSLMSREDVRDDLSHFDIVVVKVDAPNERLFQEINRPVGHCTLGEVTRAIREFRQGFRGKLALQMMFMALNERYAPELAEIAREMEPDEVQLNTPLRPSPVEPLSRAAMSHIQRCFTELPVLNVHESVRPGVVMLDEAETRRRRPVEANLGEV